MILRQLQALSRDLSPYVALIALTAALLVAPLAPAPAHASAIADPTIAKVADKCHTTIQKAGAKFVVKKLASLEKCVDALFKCVQAKPGDQKCLAKARAKCVKELGDKVAKERAKVESAIVKKCGGLAGIDLLGSDGVGYNGVSGQCATGYGAALSDAASVAACVHRQHECVAERMFDIQMPRGWTLLDQEAVPLRAESCLEDLGGAGNVGDPKGLGKALEKCQKAIKKAGKKFVGKKLKSLQKCAAGVFTCIQRKPGDGKCLTKAEKRCDKIVATTIPKEEAKLGQAISKRCAGIFASIGATSAMNLDGLAKRCAPFGGGSLATQADYIQCITLQHECLVEDLLRFQAPRATELFNRVGNLLPSNECPTPTPTMTPTPTPTLTANPGEFLLSVTKPGAGTGTVTSTDTDIDCGSDCGQSYTPATMVTLEARTANGDDSYFQHWSGDGCSGSFHDCTVPMDQSRFVEAHFAPQIYNLVFVSSAEVPPDLGDATAYDDECNALATAAGINNLAGDAYAAWTSDSSSDAKDRLASARGFVRLDGKPLADRVLDLTVRKNLNPLRIDEIGQTADEGTRVMTGTGFDGTVGSMHCLEWTSTSSGAFAVTGGVDNGPFTWTQGSNLACDTTRRIYCLGNTKTVMLVPTVPSGKLIYLPNAVFRVGDPPDPDEWCDNSKPAGTGVVEALIATTTAAAATHLDPAATYVRPDGEVVGTGQQLIDVGAGGSSGGSGVLDSGIWQSGNGLYPGVSFNNVWTGHENLTAVGTVASTCNNWTDAGGTGRDGSILTTTGQFWESGTADEPCNNDDRRLYCVEQ